MGAYIITVLLQAQQFFQGHCSKKSCIIANLDDGLRNQEIAVEPCCNIDC